MKPIRRPRICVEQLEERDCPSLSYSLAAGNLTIRGTPTPNSATGLKITQTAPNTFNVSDNGSKGITFVANNVSLLLTNHNHSPINVDLGNNTATGNLTIDLGRGSLDMNPNLLVDGVAVTNGTLAGSLTIRNGNGEENVALGYNTNGTASALTVGGNVFDSAKVNLTGQGDILDTGLANGTSTKVDIHGNLTTVAVNNVGLTSQTTVRGSLHISGGGDSLFNNLAPGGVIVAGRISQNMVINGSPGSPNDSIFLTDGVTGASIGGNFSAHLGNGTETFFPGGTVAGSATYTAGNGPNTVTTGFVPFQAADLSFNLGNGDNTFTDFSAGGNGIASNVTVSGDLRLRAGNGNNNLGTIASTEVGNLIINLGSGSNAATTLTGPVGGDFRWTSGNGSNTLTIQGSANAPSYNVNIQFGNNDDTLNVGGGGPLTLTGRADGGGRVTGNVFNPGAGFVFTQDFILSNFP